MTANMQHSVLSFKKKLPQGDKSPYAQPLWSSRLPWVVVRDSRAVLTDDPLWESFDKRQTPNETRKGLAAGAAAPFNYDFSRQSGQMPTNETLTPLTVKPVWSAASLLKAA